MVGSWGRSEVGSALSSNLVRSWGKTCGQKMGQPGLKTGAPSSDRDLVGRSARPVLRPGRSEDGAQHIHYLHTLHLLCLYVAIHIEIIYKCSLLLISSHEEYY